MKIVYQRVKRASVTIAGDLYSEIGQGAVLLLAIEKNDTEEILDWGAKKSIELRAFEDEDRKMNKSLLDIGGEVLVVSQFTLAGNVKKGRRPSFDKAESPAIADKKYQYFCRKIEENGITVKTGKFAAMMDIELVNSGPVTFIIERHANDK